MILYVETNFVLELAFLRDEIDDAEALLKLAEAKDIDLGIPAFSLSEPFEAMTRRSKDRDALLTRVGTEIAELGRSKAYASLQTLSQDFTSVIANSANEEWGRLGAVQARLIKVATVIPLQKEIISRAIEIGPKLDLTPQDAVVFASVEFHLKSHSEAVSVFATKNRKDFLTGEVEDHLEPLRCKLHTSFGSARGFIGNFLKSGDQ